QGRPDWCSSCCGLVVTSVPKDDSGLGRQLSMEAGYLGIGAMGQPMAHKLLDAGNGLTIYDINEAAMQPLLERQACRGVSPRDLARSTCYVMQWRTWSRPCFLVYTIEIALFLEPCQGR